MTGRAVQPVHGIGSGPVVSIVSPRRSEPKRAEAAPQSAIDSDDRFGGTGHQLGVAIVVPEPNADVGLVDRRSENRKLQISRVHAAGLAASALRSNSAGLR